MSDGPHKSLLMRRGWKRLAGWADNCAFDPEQMATALAPALEEDWREEGCPDLLRAIRAALGDDRQGSLFGCQKPAALEHLRSLANGRPLPQLLIENAIQAAQTDRPTADILLDATVNTLTQRASRGAWQVEEHFLRHTTSPRAIHVRANIEEAISRGGCTSLAVHLLRDPDAPTTSRQPAKHEGLDDGVRF